MISEFAEFTARLREFIRRRSSEPGFGVRPSECPASHEPSPAALRADGDSFEVLALRLFALQYACNPPYRRICQIRGATPGTVEHWSQIPAVPAAAFKEFELSCLSAEARTTVFHSSGTTAHRPSRHFHNRESLAVYEASLLPWFQANVLGDSQPPVNNSQSPTADGRSRSRSDFSEERLAIGDWQLAILTPDQESAPHSSLVHMFEIVRRAAGGPTRSFLGRTTEDNSWALDYDRTVEVLREADQKQRPILLLGTAFSFVHLVDYLGTHGLAFEFAPGSRVVETGGYKGRSRELPKAGLHRLISECLGIPASRIVCEYGMSELSSQAYDLACGSCSATLHPPSSILHPLSRLFQFPPWARTMIVSPETGGEAAGGEVGLIRVFDLANIFSVMAVQTEDLAIRRGTGFELIGRSVPAEPRGCSLNVETLHRMA